MKGINKLFLQAIFLSMLGVFVQFIFGVSVGLNQLSFLIVGVLTYLVIQRVDSRVILALNPIISFVGMALLALLLILADPIRGAQRWFVISGFNLQPSVVFLPFFLLFEAMYLANHNSRSFASFLIVLGLIGLPVAFIFKQPDLGTALIVGICLFSVTYAAYFPLVYYLWLGFIGTPLAFIFSRFLKPYQISRLISFINPHYDPSGINYNSLQSVIAIGSGFLFGKGFNYSSQSKLRFLPEAHTDFVFASFTETFGFAGSLIILIVYVYFLLSIIKQITEDNDNSLSQYYYFGLLVYFFIQSFFNIGMNLRLLPVVGVPLPFISYGGSSLLTNFIFLGIASKLKEVKLV